MKAIYGIFLGKNGRDWDVPNAIESGFKVGNTYRIKDVSMGQSNTGVEFTFTKGYYNSVMFDFYDEETGKPIDLRDTEWNPYRDIYKKKEGK